jgi:hypothetical protein
MLKHLQLLTSTKPGLTGEDQGILFNAGYLFRPVRGFGTIPRRIPYPVTLPSTNAANYAAAVGKLTGGDTFVAKVWWDK